MQTDPKPGTSRGFRIYYTDPFSLCFEEKEGDVAILEMLFSTSLVALILSPRLLRIQNTKVRTWRLGAYRAGTELMDLAWFDNLRVDIPNTSARG
jgi:hypothetical protein